MVTLSVTRSRIAGVLRGAEQLLAVEGWDPLTNPIMSAIDRAAGYVPGKGGTDAERTTLDAWETLTEHLGVASVSHWEREPDRSPLQVLAALNGAASKTVTG
ncbi:hypothetical protein [Streptomyces sp. AC555_RSS877]|uniref:DUF6197 family protein n=1 Tax=Streptomyces sp. AC555_RSS877 TaxID=2823688 RepID=UPI001C26AFB5|nr:hypothetical protein [Streptomyces sp. AC555_RSS877]